MLHKGCFSRKSFFHKLRQKVWLISKLLRSPRKKAIARGYTVSQAHYYRGVGDSAANTETIYGTVALFSFICSVDTRGWRDGTDGHVEESQEKIMKTNKWWETGNEEY